jgi:long-chain acyl-CoA synthetase
MSFNLAVILSGSAQSSPDKPAAVFTGGQITYRELDQASDRLAATLAAIGIKPGDPVALQLPNIPQFLISYFGILKSGGIVVPLNVLLKAPEVAFHLGDSGARILITWEGILAEAVKGAEAAGLDQVYAVGHAGADGHRRRGLHVRHDRAAQGRRAHPHGTVYERRHPRAAVRCPAR